MGADLDHIVFVEFLYLLEFVEGCCVMLCAALDVHAFVLPVCYLAVAVGFGHLVEVHAVVDYAVGLHCLLLFLD